VQIHARHALAAELAEYPAAHHGSHDSQDDVEKEAFTTLVDQRMII